MTGDVTGAMMSENKNQEGLPVLGGGCDPKLEGGAQGGRHWPSVASPSVEGS